jgi:hypothetical protein
MIRLIPLPEKVRLIRLYYVSNLMPEGTGFKMTNLPTDPRKTHIFTILIVAGNMTHFAGDLFTLMITNFMDLYDHVIYLPGPYDYGKGTDRLGDEMCVALGELRKTDPSLTVIHPGVGWGVRFDDLFIYGALFWPHDSYDKADVYEARTISPVNDVSEAHIVSTQVSRKRLQHDLDVLRSCQFEDAGTTVVVTWGCPAEQLCLESEGRNFYGCVDYDGLQDIKLPKPNYWIYGAIGDKERERLGTTIYCTNSFVSKWGRFQGKGTIAIRRKKKKI